MALNIDVSVPRLAQVRRPRLPEERLPLEAMMEARSFSPEAEVIKTVGNLLSRALVQRKQRQRNNVVLASMEAVLGEKLPEELKKYGTPEDAIKLFSVKADLERAKRTSIVRETFFINPDTKELTDTSGKRVERAPPGSTVKILPLEPSVFAEREKAKKTVDQARRVGEAVNKLAVLNRQFKEAFPSGDKTPLEQRITGTIETMKAKYGFTNNAKLVALQRNIRPLAINMIRLFGEVGNLSETEQKGAIDVVSQANLTARERIEQTRQFIEFSLAGANPDAVKLISQREDIKGVLSSFGVDLGQVNPPKIGESFMGGKITNVREIK